MRTLVAEFDVGSFVGGAVVGAAVVGLFVFFLWVQRSTRLRSYRCNTLGERSTDRARTVMRLANEAAAGLNHEYIGTEHILLGLVEEGAGMAAEILKKLNIDRQKIRREIDKVVQTGPSDQGVFRGKLPLTPYAKKVIEYSIEEARNLNHHYVGTEHLLLGLLRETEGVAVQVLMNLGVVLESVRGEILKLLGSTNGHARKPESEKN